MVKVDSVSHRALAVARVVDQMAAVGPGRFSVEVDISRDSGAWNVSFVRLERVDRRYFGKDYGRDGWKDEV